VTPAVVDLEPIKAQEPCYIDRVSALLQRAKISPSKAAALYQEVLQVKTREWISRDGAGRRGITGDVLEQRGERESGTAWLAQSRRISGRRGSRRANAYLSTGRRTSANLSAALSVMGERGSNAAQIKEGILFPKVAVACVAPNQTAGRHKPRGHSGDPMDAQWCPSGCGRRVIELRSFSRLRPRRHPSVPLDCG
jgi:hypothetical protein